MGIRINTAIGWGMPFADFTAHLTLPDPGLPDEDGWFDHLERTLHATSSMRGPVGLPLTITGAGDTVVDLMRLIGYDECSDVLLMPTIADARAWHRRDDDIDFAMHWGPRAVTDREVPENRIEYLPVGHHPYGNLRMDAGGADVPAPDDRDPSRMRGWLEDPTLLPGLPPCLRHWLMQAQMLDGRGMAKLRPMRAVWWS